MLTRKFLMDTLERVISTAAQALLATLTVTSVAWGQKLQVTGLAALASLLKCLVASQLGQNSTASLLPRSEAGHAYTTPSVVVVVLIVLILILFWPGGRW